MTEITITEALAEIRTIGKRITKKEEFILNHIFREERVKDPFEETGGTAKKIITERQAITDLEDRLLKIRDGIQEVNRTNDLTVEGITRTVSGWLNWRRDVSETRVQFARQAAHQINRIRQQALSKGVSASDAAAGDRKPTDIAIFMSESDLEAETDLLETILGTLDGRLTLHNATHTINL